MRRALPLLLAIAAFLIAALIWVGSSRAASHAFAPGSALNTAPEGSSLAYAYLAHRGVAKMLTTPLRNGAIPANAVLFRIQADDTDDDETEAEPGEKQQPKAIPFLLNPAEDEFVRGGGRLVLATALPGSSFDVRNDAGKVASKVFPIWPGVETLALPEPAGFAPKSLPRGMHTIFAGNGEAVITRQAIGAGDVIVIAVPEMIENQNLGAVHHLALLRALSGNRSLYFDEFAHGVASDDGALALLTEWRLGPLLILIAIAALLIFWRNARRIGPADDEERDTRSDAIDL
ncbi:MAG: hypothetical protein QOE82_2405, partial [Thermoanaerobaculia bacterium]|nr:hypothetical protein [Thermoanaerobaculia bacterium]